MCKVLLSLLAIVAPPAAVLFDQGCTCNFFINVLLTLLLLLPGTIHAWYILWCYEEPTHTTTTVYIQGHPAPPAYS